MNKQNKFIKTRKIKLIQDRLKYTEELAAICINTTHYNVSGWYGSKWIKIAESSCSSGYQCVSTVNFTSESDYINPCISENTCTGTVQIITEDRNGNPMTNLLVSRDSVSNKTTNSVGVAEYNLSKTCSQSMQFVVKCGANNGTTCGAQSTTLETNSSYRGLVFDCSICSGTPDLQIDVDNIRVNKANNNVTVNISLAGSFSATNINATFKVQGKDGLIRNESSQLFDISSGSSFKFINQAISLTDKDDFLHIYLDTNSKVNESNEKNNYALIPLFEKQIKVYFDVDTGYASVNNVIKDYIKLFVNEESNQNNADVTLCIGKKCSNFNSLNSYTLAWQNFGYKDYKLIFEGKDLGSGKPYNGIVGAFKTNTDYKKYIMAYGNDIDGDIAAVKKLISARDLFLSSGVILQYKRIKVIDDYDTTGISVTDLLRNPSNKPYYNQRSSPAFANVVSRILNNNNYQIAIKTVKSSNDNTTLRLKNIRSDFSANFTDAVVGNKRPVVLARGLWNNLLSWDLFGRRLAFDQNNARDTWLIEITGGPGQDCPTCPNYNYNDLVDYYWPALITGVQNYSGQKVIDYVGFSNGCRVGLDATKNWSSGKTNSGYIFDSTTGTYITSNLGGNAVNTFIGLGCPGAFNGTSLFAECGIEHGIPILNDLEDDGIIHVTLREYATRLVGRAGMFSSCELLGRFLARSGGDGPISTNLGRFYIDIAQSSQDKQPGTINLSKFFIIYGTNGFGFNNDNDYVVTANDAQSIFSNVISNNKNITNYHLRHPDLVDDTLVQERIISTLR